MAAPLLAATDVVGATPETLKLLTAPEVVAVNQDVLGKQGVRVSPMNLTGPQVWVKPLQDGSSAVFLSNFAAVPAAVTVTWADIGLPASTSATVRDLWMRSDLGSFTGMYTTPTLDSHAAMIVKIAASKTE